MKNISYDKFINSSFFKELQSKQKTTEEFVNFVLSLFGIENFVKNHPKPIIEYYWKKNNDNDVQIETLAEKYGVTLKPVSYGIPDITNKRMNLYYTIPKSMENMILDEKEYPSYVPLICSDGKNDPYGECFKTIELKDISNYNLKDIELIENLSSYDIINNEVLWNKNIQVDFRSERHSSDYIEHYTTYKTGWYYLSLNSNIKLDLLLISFFKNKTIVLEREKMQEYMAYNTGNIYNTKNVEAIMAFRDKDIDDQLIPTIMNDPITWEGIFYSNNFCNDSILAYIKKRYSRIEDLNL
ncbi:MAG: hypothetical protein J6I70_07140 [Bacteroidaceae bacterium]|nr:hypothetical protein [Bacteroidaceae bacterium]